jgi:hypothetical protein
VIVAQESVVVIEGDVLRPQRDPGEDVDRLLKRCDEHPPKRENGNQDRSRERDIDK